MFCYKQKKNTKTYFTTVNNMKFRLIILLLLICTFLFSEENYVCLGSFKDENKAKDFVTLLEGYKIPCIISEYKKNDEIFYRVLFSEEYTNKDMANLHKTMLENLPIIKQLNINGLWNYTKEENIVIDENRILIIKDSDSGNPISEANVNIDKKWDVKTDIDGKAVLPNDIDDGEHEMLVTKDGSYVPTAGTFSMSDGKISSTNNVSIPKAVDYQRVKIILDWGAIPADLDAHVRNEMYHVYYSNMSEPGIMLDRDDTNSYGPETITIKNPSPNSVFKYYIVNYSDGNNYNSSRLSNSGAKVSVYLNNEYKGTYEIKPNQVGLIWNVFEIINGNEIKIIDTVSNNL